jgi:PAS domain S-box-containing protein
MSGLRIWLQDWLDGRATFPVGSEEFWRERILYVILLFGIIAGLVVFVPSVWFLLLRGEWPLVLVDTLAYLGVVGILLRRQFSFRIRAWFVSLVLYALGTLLYFRLGPYSGGPTWMFTFPLIAGVLLGGRAAALALALNGLAFAVIGLLLWRESLPWMSEVHGSALRWLVYSANTLFIDAVATIAATLLVQTIARSNRRLESTLAELRQQMRLRQEAEDRLAASEERLRKIIHDTQAGYFFIDFQGVYRDVNQSWLQMHGFANKSGILGRHFSVTQTEADLPAARELVARLLDGQAVPPGTFSRRRQDGEISYHSYSINPVLSQDQVVGLEGFLIDTTETRRFELALSASEAKFRSLFNSMSELAVLHEVVRDPSGRVVDYRIIDCNQAFSRITGLPREQVVGMLASQAYGVAEPPYLEIYARTAETGEPAAFDTHFQPMNKHFHISVFSPGPDQFATIASDITQRKKAEDDLRQSEEKFRLAFATSPDAICLTRARDGAFLDANQGFERVLGYTKAELAGKTSQEVNIHADPEDRSRIMAGVWEHGSISNYEARFVTKDGRVVTGLTSAALLELDGETCVLSITREIEQLKQAEADKARLADQLRQAQKMEAIGTLAGGIAHDFNNILAAILGFAEIARVDADSGAGAVNPADLDQIILSAQRAKELVQRILAFSRKQEPDFKPLDLNQVVRRASDILERTLPKMILIQTHLAPDLPLVEADPTQLEQVLLNLASNAQDAMPEGGRLVFESHRVVLDHEYCLRHLEMRPGVYAQLSVSDSGTGMDPATRERIFEPFFTTKAVGKGTGLGLSSAFGIIKSHGGHIHCYSEPGQGSSFHIYLPMHQAGEGRLDAQTQGVPLQDLGGRETILLVDDEEALRRFAARTLESRGYRVVTAPSGERALEIYRARGAELDLVVMDLGMPGMGGRQALERLLALNPQARVIIASGYAAQGRVKEALESGAMGYVAKPFRQLDLLATVREVLDREADPRP